MVVRFGNIFLLGPCAGIRALGGVLIGTIVTGLFIAISMCAVAESFFSSPKKERIRRRIYRTRDMAKADHVDDIEVFYNRSRDHGHIGGVSPETFERVSSLCSAVSCLPWEVQTGYSDCQ